METEGETILSPDQFRCGMCGGVFCFGRSDEEARAEAGQIGLDPEDCGLVCEDCYKLTPWGRPPLQLSMEEILESFEMALKLAWRRVVLTEMELNAKAWHAEPDAAIKADLARLWGAMGIMLKPSGPEEPS